METDWFDELKALSEVPSVATACGPVTGVLRRLLPGYDFLEVPDGFFLAYPTGRLGSWFERATRYVSFEGDCRMGRNIAGSGSSVRLKYFPSSTMPTTWMRFPSRIL